MEWIEIGTMQPEPYNWQIIGIPTSGKTFKLTFKDLPSRIVSYIRIRQQFTTTEVSFSRRIYPRITSVIFDLPIPEALIEAGQTYRHISTSKFFRYHTTTDESYSIRLEVLI